MTRGTRLSLTELPEDWIAYCAERRPDLKPFDVWQDFEDYWKGRGETMVDWKRTWQTWVRNTRKKPVFTPEPPKRNYPQSKPIQAGRADSAAYREFRERMAKLKPASRSVGTFVSLGEVTLRPGAGLPKTCDVQFHRDAEWELERAAIQHEGDPV
jgi:hypothetical protein